MIVGQGSTEDIDAPSIRSYQLPTYTVDISNGNINLGSTAQITDDLSGFSWAEARWSAPTATQNISHIFGENNLTSGDNLDGNYSDTTVVNQFAERGSWTLDFMALGDEAGNYDYLSADELKDLGIQTTIELTGGDLSLIHI